jgi:hypothetical protein
LTPEAFVKQTNLDRGKAKGAFGATGWPESFTYGYDEKRRCCALTFQKSDKTTFRRAEPWGLAFLSQMQQDSHIELDGLDFFIDPGSSVAEVEAFRRRVSFLAIANPQLSFSICHISGAGGGPVLYTAGELYSRPDDEVVRRAVGPRHDMDRPGRLEKDFQTWLFGKGRDKNFDARTNERLAVLGEDFFKLSRKKFKLTREFPTGAFKDKISTTSRILPTEFVDIVTLNRHGRLAVVELKIDDPGLHVIFLQAARRFGKGTRREIKSPDQLLCRKQSISSTVQRYPEVLRH